MIAAALWLWMGGVSAGGFIETIRTDGIEYMTGGFGYDERQEMAAMAKAFNVKAVFSAQSGDYLADVVVTITKVSGAVVMKLPGAGPWLFVKLPPGKYAINAVYEGKEKNQVIDAGRRLKTIMFRWQE